MLTPRFGFTGQEFDEETGLSYYDARYYNPELGRFISVDPAGLDASDANFYRYVNNNPVTFVDPTGLALARPTQQLAQLASLPFGGLGGFGDIVSYAANSSAFNWMSGSSPHQITQAPSAPSASSPRTAAYHNVGDTPAINALRTVREGLSTVQSFTGSGNAYVDMALPYLTPSNPTGLLNQGLGQAGQLLDTAIRGLTINDSLRHSSNAGGLLRTGIVAGVLTGDLVGLTGLSDAYQGDDTVLGDKLNFGERFWRGAVGAVQFAGSVTAIGGAVSKAASRLASSKLVSAELVQVSPVLPVSAIPATSVNAGAALNTKLGALVKAQREAAQVRQLPDSRIRYYNTERLATNPGPTRGNSYVTEWDPVTGRVRSWAESYDHAGNVTRVNPKMINGLQVISPHYPPTGSELGL